MSSDYLDYLCNSHMLLPSLLAYYCSLCQANGAILNAPVKHFFLRKCYCSYSHTFFHVRCPIKSFPSPSKALLKQLIFASNAESHFPIHVHVGWHMCHLEAWELTPLLMAVHSRTVPSAAFLLWASSCNSSLCLPVSCTARTVFDLVWCEACGIPPVLPRTATALGRNRVTDFNGLCHWSASGVR